MSDKNQQIDVEKTQKFAQEVFSHLAGALVSGMIYLGERMGLYRALNGAGPLTSEELARKTGLHERWVREWLYQQAAAIGDVFRKFLRYSFLRARWPA